MTQLNRILALALGVQLMLAAGLFWLQRPVTADQAQPLLALETEQVERIEIEAPEGTTVSLVQQGDRWVMPGYHGLPVDTDKLQSALERLTAIRTGWPVVTSASGRERFEVTDDTFQRKLTFFQGDEALATLYLGTSPGFRKVHARAANQDDVYAVNFNTFDVPAKAESWLDTALLQPEGKLESLTGPDFSVSKADDQWTLKGNGNQPLDQETVDRLASGLENLRVQRVADSAALVDASDDTAYRLQARSGNQALAYRFYQTEDGYFVQRDDRELAFEIAQATYERLAGQTALSLSQAKDAEAQAELVDSSQTESTAVQ